MKKLLLVTILLISNFISAQTVVKYDYMETWNWAGTWWNSIPTSGWFIDASVSPTESAVQYGAGNGTSAVEQNWYSMPNVTGLNTLHPYQFKFRLASYTYSNTTATTRGLDVADILEVQVSTNGGVSYVSELRITGNGNATWPYTSTTRTSTTRPVPLVKG